MSRLLQRASSAILVITCTALTACAVYPPPAQPVYAEPTGGYAPAPVPSYGTEFGRVTRIERLPYATQRQTSSGLGALAGAVIGGLLGSQVGHGGGSAAAAGLGVIGGAVLGSAIEGNSQNAGHSLVYRITIRTDRGATRAFDVSSPGDLVPGDRVRVYQGEITRY